MVTLTFHRDYLSGVIDFFLMNKIIFVFIDTFLLNIDLIIQVIFDLFIVLIGVQLQAYSVIN